MQQPNPEQTNNQKNTTPALWRQIYQEEKPTAKELRKLGLTSQETVVYLSIVNERKAAREIARHLDLPSQAVYRPINSLINQGLVWSQIENKRQVFSLNPVSESLHRVAKRNQLEQKSALGSAQTRIYQMELEQTGESLSFLTKDGYLSPLVYEAGYRHAALRAKREICRIEIGSRKQIWTTLAEARAKHNRAKLKLIVSTSDRHNFRNINLYLRAGWQVRLNRKVKYELRIVDRAKAYVSLGRLMGRQWGGGVELTDPTMVKLMTEYFYQTWLNSEPIYS